MISRYFRLKSKTVVGENFGKGDGLHMLKTKT